MLKPSLSKFILLHVRHIVQMKTSSLKFDDSLLRENVSMHEMETGQCRCSFLSPLFIPACQYFAMQVVALIYEISLEIETRSCKLL